SVRLGHRKPGQGRVHRWPKSRATEPHVEKPAVRKPQPTGQSRRAAPARVRQDRPVVQRTNEGGRTALQGTRRPNYGHDQGRRWTLSARSGGPIASGGFHRRENEMNWVWLLFGNELAPLCGLKEA